MYVVGKKLADITVPYKGLYPYSITSNYSEISSDPTSWGSVLENIKAETGQTIESIMTQWKTLVSEDKDLAEQMKFSHGKVYHKQTIKMFNSAEPNQYETTFPLFNENANLIRSHLNFILKMQSLLVPNLKTINIIELPALWRFEIPGIMVIPFGFIGKFTATPKGPSKIMNVFGVRNKIKSKMTIPNAWEIHIVLNSLTPPSVQMQDLLLTDPGLGGNTDIYDPNGYRFSQQNDETTTPPPSTPMSNAASLPRVQSSTDNIPVTDLDPWNPWNNNPYPF